MITGRTNPTRLRDAKNTTERIVKDAITELKRAHNLNVVPEDYKVDNYSAYSLKMEKMVRIFKKHGIEIPPILNYHYGDAYS